MTKRQHDKNTKRQQDKKAKRQNNEWIKRQKDKQKNKTKDKDQKDIFVTSGQFRTLAMFMSDMHSDLSDTSTLT